MTAPVLKVVRAKEILADPFKDHETLTDREREIARLTARGLSVKKVAAELGIAPSTVSALLGRVSLRLGLDRGGMTQKMIERLEEALK